MHEGHLYSYEGPMEEQLRIIAYVDPDEVPEPLQYLLDLAGQGRLVQTVYRPCPSPWERLCALEEDVLKADAATGAAVHEEWAIVSGECLELPGVDGWLSHVDGWVLVACPADYEPATEFLFLSREAFLSELLPYEYGRATLGEDSGMRLNQAVREVAQLEEAMGVRES